MADKRAIMLTYDPTPSKTRIVFLYSKGEFQGYIAREGILKSQIKPKGAGAEQLMKELFS